MLLPSMYLTRSRWLFACCASVLLFGGCGGDTRNADLAEGETLGAGSYTRVVTVDGREHSYRLYVPDGVEMNSDVDLPLVVSLHGGGSNAGEHDLFTQLRDTADDATFLLMTPQGFRSTWNAGSCCAPASAQEIDHVAVIAALLDDAESVLALDSQRVYATGHSNGGMMAYRLGCELSERIAAIAPNAATMMDRNLDADSVETVFECLPGRPVPVFHMHGLADTCVPFEGGASTGPEGGQRPPVSDSIDFWVDNNRCLLPPLLSSYSNGNASCESYRGCQDSAVVTLCTIEGGGHTWPGPGSNPSEATCGGSGVTDLDANTQIWEFFSEHSL